jgi:hypothetical protein
MDTIEIEIERAADDAIEAATNQTSSARVLEFLDGVIERLKEYRDEVADEDWDNE